MVAMTRVDDERRRALALLAESPDGCSRPIMLARGFPLSLLNRLVWPGSQPHASKTRHKAIEIVRVKNITAGEWGVSRGNKGLLQRLKSVGAGGPRK